MSYIYLIILEPIGKARRLLVKSPPAILKSRQSFKICRSCFFEKPACFLFCLFVLQNSKHFFQVNARPESNFTAFNQRGVELLGGFRAFARYGYLKSAETHNLTVVQVAFQDFCQVV
jgi:hypothetical protein